MNIDTGHICDVREVVLLWRKYNLNYNIKKNVRKLDKKKSRNSLISKWIIMQASHGCEKHTGSSDVLGKFRKTLLLYCQQKSFEILEEHDLN